MHYDNSKNGLALHPHWLLKVMLKKLIMFKLITFSIDPKVREQFMVRHCK
jgi:hypothetical protein